MWPSAWPRVDQVIESELIRWRLEEFDGRRGDIEGPGRRLTRGDQGQLVEGGGGGVVEHREERV